MKSMQGILLINKDKGFTSHDVVALCRKHLGLKKIGHTGTLDPMARGVLPILVGKATKISNYLMGQDKVYEGTMQFGYRTDTLDADGEILEVSPNKIFIEKDLLEAMKLFTGKIDQVPPMYSAIKIKGKKLYEYARQGQEVERKTRQVEIYSFDLLDLSGDQISFRVSCSSGTYIRSLVDDLARELKSLATLVDLNRVQVGNFSLDQCHSISDLKEGKLSAGDLIPMDQGLDLQKIEVQEDYFNALMFGQSVPCSQSLDKEFKVYCKNQFVGIGISPYPGFIRINKCLLEM